MSGKVFWCMRRKCDHLYRMWQLLNKGTRHACQLNKDAYSNPFGGLFEVKLQGIYRKRIKTKKVSTSGTSCFQYITAWTPCRGVARKFGKGGSYSRTRKIFEHTPSLTRKVEVHHYYKTEFRGKSSL